jgi:hypothetical protein
MLKQITSKTFHLAALVVLFLLPFNAHMHIPHNENEEYTLKATFLYRFTDYIEWSDDHSDLFSIAILGQSPITAPLLDIAKVKKAKNKKISVTEYSTLEAINTCHILFVPDNCPVPIEKILDRFAGKPVFIVTEKEGYGKKGAHLNFTVFENHLKFEINTKAISRSNLTISAFLLQHAIIVE